MRTLDRINLTPVKGMGLQHPSQADLGDTGVAGDRTFFLLDETGALFSAHDFGPLVQVQADFETAGGTLTLTFPDGTVVNGVAAGSGDPAVIDFYGRPVAAHAVDGPWAGVISSYVGRPLRLMRCDRPGDGSDVFPLTVVSTASVDDLAERGRHEGPLDSRRFRINFELGGCEPYDEDSWEGRTIRIGVASIRIHGAIPRCVVTTRSPDTGAKDWDTLTQIAKYRPRIPGDGGLPFGVYAAVVSSGSVKVGDTVEIG